MSDPLNHQNIQTLKVLIPRSLDGVVSRDEAKELEDVLKSDPQARAFYRMYLSIHCDLESVMNTDPQTTQEVMNTDSGFNTQFWDALAKYERKAPAIELPDRKPKKELIEKVVYPPRQKRKVSKFNIIFLGLNAAAMLFLVLFLRLTPPKQSVEVATLSDSINAKWANIDSSMKDRTRLIANSDKLMLREGLAEILFDNDTRVIVEAPVEFQILAEDRIGLTYGKAYATVPPDAVGFSVYTPSAKVIDMGTEFGVQTGVDGNMQLHVIKGKTMLIAGRETNKIKMEVDGKVAKKISGTTGEISDIGFRSDYFVRDIDSESKVVWKGQKAINLVNILGGGNGLGSVQMSFSENRKLTSGQPVVLKTPEMEPSGYFAVESNPFIDGLFVPNGVNGPVSITQDGQLLWDAPIMQVRQKIGYLRFDISSVRGSRKGAIMTLGVRRWAGKKGQVHVYGLKDGQADGWDESKVTYNTAPGLLPAPLGKFQLDQQGLENLGTISLSGVGLRYSDTSNLRLDEFIGNDTNGLVTFILVRQQNDLSAEWTIRTKEDPTGNPPTLTFPYGENNSSVEITTAIGNGSDTYLSNDNQYDSTGPDDSHGTETTLKVRHYFKNFCEITNTGDRLSNVSLAHPPFMLDGKEYTARVSPVLAMRANSAVTFDLRKIRSFYNEFFSLKSFTAVCGPTEVNQEYMVTQQWQERPKAGFYVLVDGQERFSKRDMTVGDASCRITVKLTPQDHYLTLVTTGGTNRNAPLDWGLFVSPQINIE